MKAATVRTLRELVGLTCQEVADHAGVNIRTAQRWEAVAVDDSTIPADVTDWLWGLADWINDTADRVVEAVEDQIDEHGEPEAVDLARYVNAASARQAGITVPVGTHSAAIVYILGLLRSMGVVAEVHYITPE